MSTNIYTTDQWAKALGSFNPNSNEYKKVMGVSKGSAASELNVSRQMIEKLVRNDKIDRIIVNDKNGGQIAVMISIFSVERYKRTRQQYEQVKKQQIRMNLDN